MKEKGIIYEKTYRNSSYLALDASKVSYQTGINPYDNSQFNGYISGESGFLSSQNFSANEVGLIKDVNNKSYLIQYEQSLKEGGSKYVEIPNNVWDVYKVKDYFDQAYYRTVSDKVFSLSQSQYIKAYEVLGKDIGNATVLPAVQALLQKNYNYTGNIEYYQLRDTYMSDNNTIPYVMIMPLKNDEQSYSDISGYTGGPHSANEYLEFKDFGVRPACWIDASKISTLGGLGISSYPYILNGTPDATVKGAVNVSINNYDVKFISNSGVPYVDSANRTQVPLRVTMESYGATVNWNNDSKTAVVEKNVFQMLYQIFSACIRVLEIFQRK